MNFLVIQAISQKRDVTKTVPNTMIFLDRDDPGRDTSGIARSVRESDNSNFV
jgi:hypothetical protein